MTDPVLTIIVISYNTKELTLRCLRSVFWETAGITKEVVVLDNASADGSATAIADEFGDKIHLIVSSENLGFAAGNNRAAGYANGRYLLLLNPDTMILDRAINRLVQFAEFNPEAGIWGGRTVFEDGSLNPSSCWSKQTVWSLMSQALGLSSLFRNSTILNPEGMGGWRRDGEREVDIVSGCFLLIGRDLWRQLDGFDEAYFMYGEDADLCLRARKHGSMPRVTSDATIVHVGGASEPVRADKLERLLTAKMQLIRRHFAYLAKPVGVRLLFFWPITRWVAHASLALLGRSESRSACAVWKDVVGRRKRWSRSVF